MGLPWIASCGFWISPKANVAQLRHCSSDELTCLEMTTSCPLKSKEGAIVAPLLLLIGCGILPEARQRGRLMSLEVILFLFKLGAFEALLKMRKLYAL